MITLMKTDTEYFHDAVNQWTAANRSRSNMPFTAAQLSEILTLAQKLKAADAAKLDTPTT
jgi:hypothetical protein